MRHSIRRLTVALVALILAAVSGCERTPETTGEKFNEAVDELKEAGNELSEDVREAVDEIGNEYKPNEDRTLGEKIEEGFEEASDALQEGASELKRSAEDVLQSVDEQLDEAVEDSKTQ